MFDWGRSIFFNRRLTQINADDASLAELFDFVEQSENQRQPGKPKSPIEPGLEKVTNSRIGG